MIRRENWNGCIFLYLHLSKRFVYFCYVAEMLFVRDMKVEKL